MRAVIVVAGFSMLLPAIDAYCMCLACGSRLLKHRGTEVPPSDALNAKPCRAPALVSKKLGLNSMPPCTRSMMLYSRDADGDSGNDGGAGTPKDVELFVAMIQWYKDWISPLMGPNCRFYPTCSSYAIASLKEYGPIQGLTLTAWRILRCNPIGGKGYDPPTWPPPSFRAGAKIEPTIIWKDNEIADEPQADEQK